MFPSYYNTNPYASSNLQNGTYNLQGGGGNIQVGSTTPSMTGGNVTLQDPTVNPTYTQGYNPNGMTDVLGASTSNPQGDAATAAYYQDAVGQLQNQLNQLDPQQAIGMQNIENSYNLSANRLDSQKGTAQRDYNTSVTRNGQDYQQNRGGILQNVRANVLALQRLLGINGSGNSSAAYEQAPYAAGLQGSTQLNQAQKTFGNNQQTLETNWGDALRGFTNAYEDLNNQKYQQENALRSSIAQARASLLDKIGTAQQQAATARGAGYAGAQAARAPYQQQINDLLSQITNLGQQFANPVLRAADVTYNQAPLQQWNLNGNQAQSAQATQSAGGGASDVNPMLLPVLANGQRDQYGNIIL